jgi:DNA processing protein
MSLPNSWILEDVLASLFFLPNSKTKVKFAVEECEALGEIIDSAVLAEKYFKRQTNSLIESDFKNTISELREKAKLQIEKCEKQEVRIVTIWDEDYPQLLREINHPPVLLFVKGNLQASDITSISMVGTRTNSIYGELTAEKFATFFARHNIVVTSGMAQGIDTISHYSAIKEKGITYAVLACGIDSLSSSFAKKIASKIVESGGALISEYACGTRAIPIFFPIRNRIISGISKATVVIESGEKGGALLTARFAFDQQREVYAVPGNINSRTSVGTNNLVINSIAQIVTSPEQICKDLGILEADMNLFAQEKIKITMTRDEEKIYALINHDPVHVDDLAHQAELDINVVLVTLLNLEFKNIVRQLPGKYYIAIDK